MGMFGGNCSGGGGLGNNMMFLILILCLCGNNNDGGSDLLLIIVLLMCMQGQGGGGFGKSQARGFMGDEIIFYHGVLSIIPSAGLTQTARTVINFVPRLKVHHIRPYRFHYTRAVAPKNSGVIIRIKSPPLSQFCIDGIDPSGFEFD